MHTNTYALMAGIEKYVVSGAIAGLTSVQWHNKDGAWTDGSTIFLPTPNAEMNEAALMLWRYKAEHELGHEDAINSSPHWKAVMQEKKAMPEYKHDRFLWSIANLISDHVQEHNRVGHLIGRDEVLLKGRKEFLDQCVWRELGKKDSDPRWDALFVWDSRERAKWNPYIVVPSFSREIQDQLAVINSARVELTALKNEQEVFDAALRIRKLWEKTEEERRQEEQDKEAEKEAKEGKGSGKKSKAKPTKADKARSKTIVSEHDGEQAEAPEKGSVYGYGGRGGSNYRPRVPVPLSKARGAYGKNYQSEEHIKHVRSLLKKTNLPAKVRSYLMAMKRDRWDTGYRSGRLDTARLSDVLNGKDDLFKRKGDQRLINSAVSLLVDSSGSMCGEAFQQACASAIMLGEALAGIGVNLEIAGFTEFSAANDGLIHDVWLPFGGRLSVPRVLDQMGVMTNNLRNNADGENIMYAYNRLLCQQQPRKVLIVLSDGEPAAQGPMGSDMGIDVFTARTIEMIEKGKRVDIIGLGMSGHDPKAFYKNSRAVQRGECLERVLLEVVQKAILK